MNPHVHISSVSFDVTNQCNFRCKHCFNYSGEQKVSDKELDDQELIQLSNQIIDINPDSACICGGEPLLRTNIVLDLIKKLSDANINVNMVSNGYLLDYNTAKKLVESGISLMQISIDGFEEDHDWLRGRTGSFKKAIDSIDMLVDLGCNVSVACTPTIRNIDDVEDLIHFLNQHGVLRFRMQPIMNLGRAKLIHDYFPTNIDYNKLARRLGKISTHSKMTIEWGDPTEHLYSISNGFPLNYFVINPYGDVLLTPYIPIAVGNVRSHSLEEYLNAGYSRLGNNKTIQSILSMITNENEMDLSDKMKLPGLYESDFFKVDIIDDDFDCILSEFLK